MDAAWSVSHGESTFTILAPQELCGMTVRCTADGATMTLDGVETALPGASPFVQVAGAYRAFMLASPEGTLTEHGWLYDMRQSEGFTVLQDTETGLPQRLFLSNAGITVSVATKQ